jgi:protease-4
MPAQIKPMKRFFTLLLLACVAGVLSGCMQVELFSSNRGPLLETRVFGERGPKILMVDIDGVIRQDANTGFLTFSESTVARVREQLDVARNDEDVRAILLRVDTPGGSATASDVIYTELMRFKQERGVPVIAHFMGMATSGGYYVAMAADEIVAEPTNVTGSIGVILVGVDLSGLMSKFGVADQTITGGRLKDAGSPLRSMTPEERGIFQSVIDDLHERFRTVVEAGRPKLSRERVVALSDGRIFSAPQALDHGLIDAVGSIEDTVDRIEARLGVEAAVVVSYHRRGQTRRNLYTQGPSHPPSMRPDITALSGSAYGGLAGMLMPGFHYLWWPGAAR